MADNITVPMDQDYLVWDNTCSGVLTSHQVSPGNDVKFDVPVALRRAPKYSEIASSGGKYTAQDLVWLIPQAVLARVGATGNRQPKAGDSWEDGTTFVPYTVLGADYLATRSTWRLTTRDIILAYGLYDTVSVERPTGVVVDAAGGRTYAARTVVYAGVTAAIKETSSERKNERGRRLTVSHYSVWVYPRLFVSTGEDRLIDQNGLVYEILESRDPGALDKLQELVCRRAWS